MKFGIFDYFHDDAPYGQRFRNHRDLAVAADEGGLDFYFTAEHHADRRFAECPSPGVFLGAAAVATNRIRLGPMGYVVPLWNPARLAEEIAMLDQVSNGRLELGLVSGINYGAYRLLESDNWGNDGQKDLSFWNGAEKMMGKLTAVGIDLVQYPHPPIWHSTRSLPWIRSTRGPAARGWSTAQWVQPRLEVVREIFNTYREAGSYRPPHFGLLREVYVADDRDRAIIEGGMHWREFWRRRYDSIEMQDLKPNVGVSREERKAELFNVTGSIRDGSFICGTPDMVTRQIEMVMSATGANVFLADFTFGPTRQQAMRSLRLFVDEVVPGLRGEL